MKRLLLLLIIPLMFFFSCSIIKKNKRANTVVNETLNEVDGRHDMPPIYPGCSQDLTIKEQKKCFQEGLMQHIKNNFHYPEYSLRRGLSGKVFVSFVIDTLGQVSQAKIAECEFNKRPGINILSSERLEAEKKIKESALILINSVPNMVPRKIDNKSVPATFTIPIKYSLQKKERQ